MGSLLTHHCEVKGDSLTVRQVLDGVIAGLAIDLATGKKMPSFVYAYAWDLVYDPNWNKYFLSLWRAPDNNPQAAPIQATRPDAAAAKTGLGQEPGRVGTFNRDQPHH